MNLEQLIDPQSEEACAPWKLKAVQEAISTGLIGEDHPLLMIYSLDRFKEQIDDVKTAFPEEFFLHTIALKANPVLTLLKKAGEEGIGFEAASLGELTQALKVGKPEVFNVNLIVEHRVRLSSQNKSRTEILIGKSILKLVLTTKGVYLNLDNFQELERVTELVNSGDYKTVNVGIRINPQVGFGSIKEMSTSAATSKFGVAIDGDLERIYKEYLQRPWLNGVHVHVGSQGLVISLISLKGCPIDLSVEGIRIVFNIAKEINQRNPGQIKFVDIGGGLAVNFDSEANDTSTTPSLRTYSDLLRKEIPELFSGSFRVITEFGRRYNAKPGMFVSRVEYAKEAGGRAIAAIHAGADLMVRTVFMPTKWAVRVTALDSEGKKKSSENLVPQDLAGPCCHGADIVAHQRPLPLLEAGDYVVLHDTGAYYYSAFSYYNSRQAPAIYGYREGHPLELLKAEVSVEQTLSFFS